MMLELQDIYKSYALGAVRVEVLNGVNLRVDAGEFVSVIGSSGCGKSTLMHIIGFLDTPTSGEYVFEGRKTAAFMDEELCQIRNRKIGFVFQQFHLLPRLSALENICLPLVYRNQPEATNEKIARQVLDRVGMAGREMFRPGELSGGQQQRIAIARALAASPSLILADEPTGALDSQTGQEIMNLFLELNREGITVLIITHDPKIAGQCKRVVRMQDGTLREA